MQKESAKVLGVFLLLVLATVASSAILTPVFAKNMHVPEDAKIDYWSGGIGVIEVPASWPSGGVPQSTLRFYAFEVEAGSLGSSDVLIITVPAYGAWVAVAIFATNPNVASFLKTIRSGMPAAMGPLNTKSVSESVLKVERQGNRINVELTAPQKIYWTKTSGTGVILVSIPAFTMELDKIDGSIHKDHIDSFTGYAGASGYLDYVEEMGFNANGAFTCEAWWGTVAHPMTTCFITMHGIMTHVPPV